MILKSLRRQNRGQSLVEFTLVLPFLLLLALGLVESGYAFYDYLLLSNSNREGVRLAARGRFADADISDRIIATAGMREVDGAFEPLFAIGENFGVIITRIPLHGEMADLSAYPRTEVQCCQPDCEAASEGVLQITRCVKGSINENGSNTPRPLELADSRVDDLSDFQNNVDASALIESLREDGDYARMDNVMVIVETYLAHPMLLHLPEFFPIPDPMSLYFKSTMRVTLNSRRP
ncbi:MAG: pilus assembly protein [Anaerolineae bacterium]|nr:pilus assembly protein [Anaerolineae bacterium]